MEPDAAHPWLAEPRLARLLDYWRSRRPGPDLLPARTAIDPLELGADLLPYVAIVETIGDHADYRFRLVGSKLTEHAGLDLTGRRIFELNPNQDYATYIAALYRQSAKLRLPIYSETQYRAASGRQGQTRRLTCPLAADGQAADMYVVAQVFQADGEFGDAPTYTFATAFLPVRTIPVPD